MAPGFWGKVKNFFKKVGQGIVKGAKFVIDKVAPVVAPIAKVIAPALNVIPGVGPALSAGVGALGTGLDMVNKVGPGFRPLLDKIS